MKQKSKKLCSGCYQDYYNHHREDGCWNFAGAKVVQLQRVGIMEEPPYKWNPEDRLNCYSPQRFVMLTKDDPRIRKGR